MKGHEDPSSGNRVDLCRRRDIQTDGQTDGQKEIVKLIVAFFFSKFS